MTFKCDPTTRAELNAQPHKAAWATTLNAALGNSRQLVCKQDTNPNATDPGTTGTIFRQVTCTGAIRIVSGKVVGFGTIKGTTVSQPADLSVGKSVLRVEGNGRWIEVSLGLPGSGADVIANGAFTATNGINLKPDFALSGPRFLPSGTGPAAPAKVATSPHTAEVWNHTNATTPLLVGTITFNNRQDDWVYEDAEMAAAVGDAAVWQSTDSVLFGIHEFGATMTISHPNNGVSGTAPLYEVVISMATRGAWSTYPANDTFPASATTTHPDPFKIILKDQNGVVVHTYEMHDGLPINDPSLHQGWFDSTPATGALRPLTNTGMLLHWWSERPAMHDKAKKYYPGLTADGARPTQAKAHFTFLASPPLVTGGYQRNSVNGLGTFWVTDQWPRPYGPFTNTPPDPYASYDYNRSGSSAFSAPWAYGWDYEPGSISHHDWFTGPGGPRQDRCVTPSVLSMWLTNPTGNRLAGNVPWRDVADGFMRGAYNFSNHWVDNVKTMTLSTNQDILDNWGTTGNYYGGDGRFPGKTINQIGVVNGASAEPRNLDSKGQLFWGGFSRDPLHSYGNTGWGALFTKSQMFAIGAKFDMSMQAMLCEDGRGGDQAGDYLVRTQAWNWLQHAVAWKIATTHPLGYTRKQIEDRFVIMLEGLYDQIYVPAFIENNPADKFKALRNLGVWSLDGSGANGGGLGFYNANTLLFMKQCGLWAAIKARGGKAWTALRMHMRNLDTFCFGYVVDSTMAYGHYVQTGLPVPANWTEFQTRKTAEFEAGSLGDWNRLGTNDRDSNYVLITANSPQNGELVGERDVADHLFAQYAYMRRDFFPEEPHPKLAAACAKFDMYYQRIKDRALAGGADHIYRYPGMAPIAAPLELGPV